MTSEPTMTEASPLTPSPSPREAPLTSLHTSQFAALRASLRPSLPALITLLAISVLLGIGPLIITVTTLVPLLAVPAAAGLPFLIPALRFGPLGDSTWAFWVVDTLAVIVMLVIVALRLANSRKKHPKQSRSRRFFAAWAAIILGVVVANLVRGVFASFVVQADIATYGGYLLANVLVSALFGALFGLLPAVVAAVIPWKAHSVDAGVAKNADDAAEVVDASSVNS